MFGKSKYITVTSGRYKGECVGWSKKYQVFAIKDLVICQRNVSEFKVVKRIPWSYAKTYGYLCRIIWRDGTESEFIANSALISVIIESLKSTPDIV